MPLPVKMGVQRHRTIIVASVAIGLFTAVASFSSVAPIGWRPLQLHTSIRTPVASLRASTASGSESSSQDGGVAALIDNDLMKTLDDALKYNSSSASTILEKIQTIRSSGGSQEEVDELLDTIISIVDGGVPFWARFRSFARFSSRARRASLKRVLDLSTPTLEESDSEVDEVEGSKRSRRRSLVVLLRTLAAAGEESKIPSIRLVEKEARREAKEGATSEEMATRLPPGLETPEYSIVARRPAKKGAYEIRKYEAYSMCTVPMKKPRPLDASKTDAKVSNPQLSGASSFGALAGYLFGKNSDSTAMKMTTPVLTVGDGDGQTMSFVMPSNYWDEGGIEDRAPQPLEGSGVRLERDMGGYRAAVMFGGYTSKAEVKRRKSQLLEDLEKDKKYDIVEGAPIGLAQYNDPFTPPWKRRNEVFVTVVPSNE